jgi:hypothetical protein
MTRKDTDMTHLSEFSSAHARMKAMGFTNEETCFPDPQAGRDLRRMGVHDAAWNSESDLISFKVVADDAVLRDLIGFLSRRVPTLRKGNEKPVDPEMRSGQYGDEAEALPRAEAEQKARTDEGQARMIRLGFTDHDVPTQFTGPGKRLRRLGVERGEYNDQTGKIDITFRNVPDDQWAAMLLAAARWQDTADLKS